MQKRDADRAERDLVGGASVRDVAAKYSLSKSAVGRLRRGIAKRMANLQTASQADRLHTMLRQLGKVSAETRRVYLECVDDRDWSTALRALARMERQWQMLAVLLGQAGPAQRLEIIDVSRDEDLLSAWGDALAAVLDGMPDERLKVIAAITSAASKPPRPAPALLE